MEVTEIWHVTATSTHPVDANICSEPDENGVYIHYDHYFTSRSEAHRMYELGEKTMGTRYGLLWSLVRLPVDTHWAQVDMDNLAEAFANE